ncbi:uncharacterized protein F4822DRAFT_445809 [Hypoxylon trugodes]|uniref:uncharacterized protein n=1 Tax=Hypoxylon trugodes TaxID=326681 RepID=UPI0021A23C9D|nr:uncharacterized protein F4822DRAFT_445809 [Hypoxylon trugodes]KAI1386017.1 hypothetical protein F4822DRAFT_445809 [Hypoxylon trugodes]
MTVLQQFSGHGTVKVERHFKLDSRRPTIGSPYPATKLVIGQHFWIHPSRQSWAWFIVASFYDSRGRELWHIELFTGCRDINASNTTESLASEDADTSEASTTTDYDYDNDSPSVESEDNSEASNFDSDSDSDSDSDNDTDTDSQDALESRSSTQSDLRIKRVPASRAQSSRMSQPFGVGWNPQYGVDRNANAVPGPGQPPFMNMPMPTGGIAPGPGNQGPVYVIPRNGYNRPVPVFPGHKDRLPNPHPVVNMDAPALNLTNTTGGVGCEPGYNYFFPRDHTKLHIIKSSVAPWRLAQGMSMHFGAYHVPTQLTLSQLLEGFGAVNPLPQKNKITEVIQGGNGRWYRGMTYSGDSPDMSKTLASVGLDHTRTGNPGEKPVAWLWITKD